METKERTKKVKVQNEVEQNEVGNINHVTIQDFIDLDKKQRRQQLRAVQKEIEVSGVPTTTKRAERMVREILEITKGLQDETTKPKVLERLKNEADYFMFELKELWAVNYEHERKAYVEFLRKEVEDKKLELEQKNKEIENELEYKYERLYNERKIELEKSIELQKLEIALTFRKFKHENALFHTKITDVVKDSFTNSMDYLLQLFNKNQSHHFKSEFIEELEKIGAVYHRKIMIIPRDTPQDLIEKIKLYDIQIQYAM